MRTKLVISFNWDKINAIALEYKSLFLPYHEIIEDRRVYAMVKSRPLTPLSAIELYT